MHIKYIKRLWHVIAFKQSTSHLEILALSSCQIQYNIILYFISNKSYLLLVSASEGHAWPAV